MTEDQLRELTVHVVAGASVGSGFFVGPGLVLTCAHVLRSVTSGTTLKVVWKGQSYSADVRKMQPECCDPGVAVLPDIALLAISMRDHPRAEIGDECAPGQDVYAYGYPAAKPDGDPLLGRCEGTDGRGLLKFRDTMVDHGMSGAPLLNRCTGTVCGMVKATRDKDWPVGGFAVPGDVLRRFLTPPANELDIFQGLPTRWASQVDAFLLQYLGTAGNPAPFGGRQNDLAELDRWLEDESAPQYGLLAARAGLGKSALLAHWIHRLRQGRAGYGLVYFPISARRQTNSESAVFESLAFRLASLFGEPAPQSQDLRELRNVVLNYLSRAAEESRQLLVVVDGLDEAAGWEPGADLFPPRSQGHVRVLVAARPFGEGPRGWLGRLGWNIRGIASSFPLNELDRDGIADVLRQMGNPLAPLADRLNVVDALFEKSQGDPLVVGLYVEKLREYVGDPQTFDAGSLQRIEPGLGGYFRYWLDDQIRLWGDERHEQEPRVRALMALCSLAHGPLSQEDVRALAPELFSERRAVEQAAHDLRRLLVGDGRIQGYVFGHPRLADFVRVELLEENERLFHEQRFLDYGRRVIDEFQHGGRGSVPEYVIRWHSTHLSDSGLACLEFRPFLNARWCAEWERVDGTPAGFLADLDKVWRRAGAAGDLDVRIRVSLLRSSILTRGRGIGKELFAQCVKTGVLSPALAEVIARQQVTAAEVSEYLLVVADALGQQRLLGEALAAARQIGEEGARASALSAVAKRLGPGEREKVLGEALVAALQIRNENARAWAVSAVAECLGPGDRELLGEVLAAARQMGDKDARARALSAVAECLGPGDRELLGEVLAAARQMGDKDARARALSAVAECLGPGEREKVLGEALAVARSSGDEYARANALSAVAYRLGPGDRELLGEVLAAARQIGAKGARARALSAVAERLGPGEREKALGEALAVARQIGKEDAQAWALSAWMERLGRMGPGELELLAEAIAERHIGGEYARARVLSAVAERLGPGDRELLGEVLAAARQIEGEDAQAWALSAVAERLGPGEREIALGEALAAARHIGDEDARASALSAVAECLGPGEREIALGEALATARQIGKDDARASALSAVAERLGPGEREKVLGEALEVARQIRADVYLERALSAVAERLGPGERELLGEVLAAARQIESGYERSWVLRAVAGRLGPDDRELLGEALVAARQIGNDDARTRALSAVAERLGPGEREKVLGEALAVARQIGKDNDRASALSAVAERLGPGEREKVLGEALAAAGQIGMDKERAWALRAVAYRLGPGDPELLGQALAVARQIGDEDARATALSAVAERLGPGEREKALGEALAVARQIGNEYARANALSEVAERLRPGEWGLLAEVHAQALRMADSGHRSRVLSAVATRADAAGLAVLADSMLAVVDNNKAQGIPLALAGCWLEFCHARNSTPADEIGLWLAALSRAGRSDLIGALTALAPALEIVGGQPAVSEVAVAIVDAGRWWP
jgi:hypothetical protein